MRSPHFEAASSRRPLISDRFRLQTLQRAFARALIVAGLLMIWVAPSAQAFGIYWISSDSNLARANRDGTALLVGAGVVGLVIAGRRRMAKQPIGRLRPAIEAVGDSSCVLAPVR